MSKDILFKTHDFVFSYRVGGIINNNGKVLLGAFGGFEEWIKSLSIGIDTAYFRRQK